MSERTKRFLLIIGFILSVIVIATLLYFAFFRSTPSKPVVEPTKTEPTASLGGLDPSGLGVPSEITQPGASTGLQEADTVAQGGLTQTTQLTSAPIASPTLSEDGTAVHFYDATDGKFYRLDANGEIKSLSEKQFPSLEKATWGKEANKAVLEFPDGSNIVYDFENETQVTLPKHWEDFDFSPTTDELIAKSIGIDPENRWLVVSNANGSNVKSIQALGNNESKVQVNWSPNDQVIAFSDTAEGLGSFDRRTIIPLGKKQENFKGLVVEGLGFKSQWSPDGKKLLYSVAGSYSQYRPLLWIVNATSASMGEERKSLSLNTWVDKCTFSSSNTALCAVPQGLPPNAGLQPAAFSDYPDALYEVNIETGATKLIAIPSGNKEMKNLFVTADKSLLYYTNADTGNLEFIKLK